VDEEATDEVLLAVVEDEGVAGPNCIIPVVVSVTLFACGAELLGFEVPGPLSSWYSV
jgi:hypothetical protein